MWRHHGAQFSGYTEQRRTARNSASAYSCSCLIVVIGSISAITAIMAVFAKLMFTLRRVSLLFCQRRPLFHFSDYVWAPDLTGYVIHHDTAPDWPQLHCNFRKSMWQARGPDWSKLRNGRSHKHNGLQSRLRALFVKARIVALQFFLHIDAFLIFNQRMTNFTVTKLLFSKLGKKRIHSQCEQV